MPEAVIFIAGFLSAYGGYVAVALAVASYVNTSRQARRARLRAEEAARLSIKDRTVTVRSAIFPHQYVFGRAKFSGAVLYAASSSNQGVNNMLDLVIGMTGHQLDGVEKYYFGTEEAIIGAGNAVVSGRYAVPNRTAAPSAGTPVNGIIALSLPGGTLINVWGVTTHASQDGYPGTQVPFTFSGNNIHVSSSFDGQLLDFAYEAEYAASSYAYLFPYLGASTQVADSALVAAHSGEWTTDHRLRGRGYLFARLFFNPDIWFSGIPDIAVVARGFRNYDPRTASTYWNTNAALCIRTYLTSPYGLNCSTDEIDETSFISSANISDEYVTVDTATTGVDQARWTALLNAGVTAGTWEQTGATTYRQRRYTCNGVFDAGEAPLQVLSDMLSSCVGTLSYTGGKWRLAVGAYSAPTIPALTENDMRGPMEIVAGPGHAELFNAVRGSFVGPMNKYIETDYQPAKNATYQTQDGGELIYGEQPLPFTNDALAAQRIAKVVLDRERQAIRVSLQLKLVGLQLRPGDVFPLTLARPGWVNKPFRVERWEFTTDNDLGVNIVAQEEAATSYDWNLGAATLIDTEPNTTLPSPWYVAPLGAISVESGTAQLLQMADGTVQTRAKISWTPPTDLSTITVQVEYLRVGDVDYVALAPERAESGFTYINSLQDGQGYLVRARGVNSRGTRSFWSYVYFVAVGKTEPPEDLLTFVVEVVSGGIRRYTVTAPLGILDGADIRIRYVAGSSTTWAAMSEFHAPLKYNPAIATYSFESALPPDGTYSFGAKLYDTSGNESFNARIITGALLTNAPVIYRSAFNMLTNADWEEDLGYPVGEYYLDTRSLRAWGAGYSHGGDQYFGRNYGGGQYWNMGRGGAWMYSTNITAGRYQYIYQWVPVSPGTEYELQVLCSIHRQYAYAAINWYTANQGTHLGSISDGMDAGNTVIGTASHIETFPKFWCKGTAPAGTAWALVHFLMQNTAATGSGGYTFWHKAMLNLAPPGVTRATATQWSESNPSTLHGGVIVGGSVTDVMESKPADGGYSFGSAFADGQWIGGIGDAVVGSITFTNTTPSPIFVVFQYFFNAWYTCTATPTFAGSWARIFTNLNGAGDVLRAETQFNAANGSSSAGLVTGNYTLTVPAGQSLTATLKIWTTIYSNSSFSGTSNFRSAILNIQGVRK